MVRMWWELSSASNLFSFYTKYNMAKRIVINSGRIEGTPLIPRKEEFEILFKRQLGDEDWPAFEEAAKRFAEWSSGVGTASATEKITSLRDIYVPEGEREAFMDAVRRICDVLKKADVPFDESPWEEDDFKQLCKHFPESKIPELKEAILSLAECIRTESRAPRKTKTERTYELPTQNPKYQEAIKKLPEGATPISGEDFQLDGELCEALGYLGILPIGFKRDGDILHIYISHSVTPSLGGIEEGQVRKGPRQIGSLVLKSEHKMDPYKPAKLIWNGIRRSDSRITAEDVEDSRPLANSNTDALRKAGMHTTVEEEFRLNRMAWNAGVRVLKPIAIVHDVDSGESWLAEQLGAELEHELKKLAIRYAKTHSEDDWERICAYINSAFVVALTFEMRGYTSPDLKGRNVVIITDLFGNTKAVATDSFPQKYKKLTPYQQKVSEIDPERARRFLPFGTTPQKYPFSLFGELYSCINQCEELDDETKEKILSEINKRHEELKKELEALEKGVDA